MTETVDRLPATRRRVSNRQRRDGSGETRHGDQRDVILWPRRDRLPHVSHPVLGMDLTAES